MVDLEDLLSGYFGPGGGGAGPAGATGAQGPLGPEGLPGEPGEDGLLGPSGPQGAGGASGSPGAIGSMGLPVFLLDEASDGQDGPPGPKGADGATGSTGGTGAQGTVGPALFLVGESGEDGDIGPPGVRGTDGSAGSAGGTGAAGAVGPAIFLAAEPGDDAYGWPGPAGTAATTEPSGATLTQIAAHSVDTYYKGFQLPTAGMRAGMFIQWQFPVTKGAAGVATPIYQIRIGPNQSVVDTSRLTLTGVLQSGVADSGWVKVLVVVRSVSATGVLQGSAWIQHNLATTGLASGATSPAGFNMVQATSAGFDNTALSGQFVGLSVNPGALGAWVVEQVIVKCWY